MTQVALLSQSIDMNFLLPALRALEPGLDVAVWPEPRALEAEVAVCWDPPRGVFARMPRLKLVHSIAAGVDNVLAGQTLGDARVCRVADPSQAQGMLQYVLWGVLYFHRGFDRAADGQRRRAWERPLLRPAAECRVGVMGLGELGRYVACGLSALGFRVSGWARTPRTLDGVAVHTGDGGLPAFLAQTDILVCLLPLTPQTRGILDRRTFAGLPQGSALIHVGRGEHLVEDDLLQALARGQLRGALVDVFPEEPLPPGHPFWQAPGLVVTPHMATMASAAAIAQQIVRNLRQHRQGAPLYNEVDVARGY